MIDAVGSGLSVFLLISTNEEKGLLTCVEEYAKFKQGAAGNPVSCEEGRATAQVLCSLRCPFVSSKIELSRMGSFVSKWCALFTFFRGATIVVGWSAGIFFAGFTPDAISSAEWFVSARDRRDQSDGSFFSVLQTHLVSTLTVRALKP